MAETKRKTEKLPPPPANDALYQVELITGSEETAIRVRCVGPKGAQEREGSLSELHSWIDKRNHAGDNVYVVAQVTGQIPEGAYTKDADVTEVRCIYADGDESELPESWHVPPTFTLVHPKTGRWWAFWTVQLIPLDKLSELVRRIAANYNSDPSISNPARIVRLAGYDRWKNGKNYGPYKVHRLSGATTEQWQHEGLPPVPASKNKRHDPSKPILPAQGVVIDHPRNIKDYTNWCCGKSVRTIATPDGEVAAPCIEGQGGNNMLAATGAMALDYGLSDDVALEVALEHFNPRCEPPWDEDDFERHFRSGYRSALANGGQLGSRAPARDTSTLFKPVRLATVNGEPVSDPDARYHELVRYFESVLAASGERERQGKRFGDITPFGERAGASWAIEKWLLKNATNALFGESEAFKTYVTINMLLCVATGTPWDAYEGFEGHPVDGPRDVILFAGEGYDDVLDRIDAAIEGGGFDRKLVEKHLIIVSDVYALNWANGLARMADEIEALDARPAIIAVDTYNLALDGNEDGSDEAKRALRGLRALATLYDAAGLVLHHPGWGDTKRPRGSSAFRANADVMILCERAPGDAKMASLTQYKNRSADKTKYRAALVGNPVDLGVDDDTGEAISNLSFSPINPSAVPSARDDSGLTKIGMANLYAEGLAQVLLDADGPILGPSAAAQALREWLVSQDHKAPIANSLRKHFLYAVRDAIEGEPAYAAAYLIHSRDRLAFSHPNRVTDVKRALRVTAEGFSGVTKNDAK